MKSGRKDNGQFSEGNAGGGRKPLPEDIKAARNLSYEEMCRSVIEVRNMTVDEAKTEDLDKLPLGKRAIFNAFVKLDYKGIKEYEDRLWGKAKDFLDVELPTGIKIVFEDIEK